MIFHRPTMAPVSKTAANHPEDSAGWEFRLHGESLVGQRS
jgi:hypothetical protein